MNLKTIQSAEEYLNFLTKNLSTRPVLIHTQKSLIFISLCANDS